jgi:SAM-dependent methyltransferase
MRKYDPSTRRLVYFTVAVSPNDWDQRWIKLAYNKLFMLGRNAWLVAETQRFLGKEARVLDGGCGCGDKVYSLGNAGFQAFSFDTATHALHRAKTHCPNLCVAAADIRRFPLPDGSNDGYWSLGVFEHFQEGMEAQWKEARRVLRLNGLLFLTMPALSPIRGTKARLGLYPLLDKIEPGTFYQYAYSSEEVMRVAAAHGFVLRKQRFFDCIKGLKDEVAPFRGILQRLYDSSHFTARWLRRIADILLRSSCGHMSYFVFEKKHA